jgi:hypothetical protein
MVGRTIATVAPVLVTLCSGFMALVELARAWARGESGRGDGALL